MRECGACGASVGRRQWSDYWRCDNGHTIYRTTYPKPPRYELRTIDPLTLRPWELKEAERGGYWAVWDLVTDQPWYDPSRYYYAWVISEAEARELHRRLNA